MPSGCLRRARPSSTRSSRRSSPGPSTSASSSCALTTGRHRRRRSGGGGRHRPVRTGPGTATTRGAPGARRSRRSRSRRDRPCRGAIRATAAEAAAVAAGYRDELRHWVAETPRPDAYGGPLAADAAQTAAEARRAEGVADPAAWRAAVEAADGSVSAWRQAYARYRNAEALLPARAPRRDAAAALGEAAARATALGAAPLLGWIEALARRSRIEIPAAQPSPHPRHAAKPAPRADDHGLTAREREVLRIARRGPYEPAHRRGAVHQREHGRRPRLEHPRQARRDDPDGGRDRGRPARPGRLRRGLLTSRRDRSGAASAPRRAIGRVASRPMPRMTPTRSNPQRSCSARLASFSTMIPARSVQNPAASGAGMSASSNARPTPRPRSACGDVDALPGDAAVDPPRGVSGQRDPADRGTRRLEASDQPAVVPVRAVEVVPVGRLALERGVAVAIPSA